MGKSSAPAAPDYVGQANATAAGNLAAARSQTQANRIDQVTPYGTLKYTQGDGGFNQQGYDDALSRYNSQQAQIRQNAGLQEYYGKTGQLLSDPDRNDFVTGGKDNWSSTIELSPEGQQLLDAYNRTSLGMAGLQDDAMARVKATLGQDFDMSGLQDMGTNVDANTGMDSWQKYSDLLMQRMNPDLDNQQSALDTKLANQGLTQGSEGWGNAQTQFGKQRADAGVAAQLAGAQVQQQMYQQALQNANLKNTSRQQQLTERATLRQLPLNELNALRAGSQVTNPTFSTPGQQGQTSGPDLLGAAGQQYNSALNQTNARNAEAAQTAQAGTGLASLGIAAYGAGFF